MLILRTPPSLQGNVRFPYVFFTSCLKYGRFPYTSLRFERVNAHRSAHGRPVFQDISQWEPIRGSLTAEQRLWRQMSPNVQSYDRVRYAGHLFRTAISQRKKPIVHDDSHVRQDYLDEHGNLQKCYGAIKGIYLHTQFPGGPSKIVLKCFWYQTVEVCPVAGNTIVRKNPNYIFNHESPFVFLDNCYQLPVAVWPYDVFKQLPENSRRREHYDVLDRNQSQDI